MDCVNKSWLLASRIVLLKLQYSNLSMWCRCHQPFIPANPAKPISRPCLLLYDLKNAKHKDNLVYKHIDFCKREQPSALYTTSGAGKTRSIFEYLSQNYGLYFVAHLEGGPEEQVGSADLMGVLTRFISYGTATAPTQNSEELEGAQKISNENLC
jgi:hypothetical protein